MLLKTPTGSGASVGFAGRLTGRPSTVAYITWMPPGAAGEVGGASAIMNFPALRGGPGVPAVFKLRSRAPPSVPLSIDAQVAPAIVGSHHACAGDAGIQDVRAPGGDVVSSCRERTSPAGADTLYPVQAAIIGNEQSGIASEVDRLVIHRIDDDDVDDLTEEDVGIAGSARRIA